MKVFLINLDKDKDRLSAVSAQLNQLGVAYAREPAVCAKDEIASGRLRVHAVVNLFRWWCSVGVPPRAAEIGCALSHFNLYRRLVAGEMGGVCCILEDDVVLSSAFPRAVAEVERWIGTERPRVVMLSDHTRQYDGRGCVESKAEIRRSQFACCTDAYILNARAAAALLKANFPLQRPCDHWAKWVKRGAIELYHYTPCVARQDQEAFGTSTQAGLTPISELPLPKWAWFKFKRVIGKSLDALMG